MSHFMTEATVDPLRSDGRTNGGRPTSLGRDGLAGAEAPVAAERRQMTLEAVRAVAAGLVLTYHLLPQLNITHPGFLPPIVMQVSIRFGAVGVSLFFVLSGFLLYRPFSIALAGAQRGPAVARYLARRFARIFPAYWVALSVFLFVVGPTQVARASDVASYYLLAQNYRTGDLLHGLGVAWTLVIEVSFYVVLPLLAFLFALTSPGRGSSERQQLLRIGTLAGIGLLVRVWVYFLAPTPALRYHAWQPFLVPANWLPGYLDWFAIGMALAVLWVGQQRRGWADTRVLRALRNPRVAWPTAIALYAIDYLFNPGTHAFSPADLMIRNSLYPVAAGLVLAPLALATTPNRRGGVFRLLVAVGAISYGVYLWHTVAIHASRDLIDAGTLPRSAVLQMVVALAGTLVVAMVSYFVIERPFIRLAHRVRRHSPGAPRSQGDIGIRHIKSSPGLEE
jgi:peptidoglycan/LPS O-acetylase OafA/YrhL